MLPPRHIGWSLVFILIAVDLAAAEGPAFTGPCTRRTSVVLSEIHYHPAGDGVVNFEFVELYNSSPIGVDLSGWKLRGDADFDIPDGTRLEGGRFLIIAADPTALAAAGVTAPMVGPWAGELSNKSGTVRLRKASGGIVLETNYEDDPPWPLAADGAGHSLVLAHPALGESRPEAWAASAEPGGSPGGVEPVATTALENLIVSEVLSAPFGDGEDFVEFYNPGPGSADLSGCMLSADRDLLGYAISAGTTVAEGGYLHFGGAVAGFDFDASGDRIYLRAPDGLKVLAARKFEGQEAGRSWGGTRDWRERTSPTPGAANSPPLQRPVVINEIHYHPANDDDGAEFIELHNSGGAPIDLSGWRLEDAVDYTFPAGVVIDAGGFLVVTAGEFSGSLSNSSERIALTAPGNILADEVTYFDGGRWPEAPDGGGTTLQLIDPLSDNALAPNWRAGDESGTAVEITVEHTGVLDLGHQKAPTATRAFVMLMGEGEAIIDDLEVLVGGENRVANGDFSAGAGGWSFFGTHKPSAVEGGALHAVSRDGGGDLANLIETTLTSAIAPGETVTLRARCRWVSGDPDILLGLNGGWLEAPATLPVPLDVGTPGAANFGQSKAGPAITEVGHSPLLPQAGEPIAISARVADPDGVAAVRIRYRIDPNISVAQITMTHTGDGVYTGSIPAQPAGTMVAFHLISIDAADPGVVTRFPADAPGRECLVRVGEVTPAGAFSTMRIWVTQASHDTWRDRERSSNLDLDATFVSDGRAYYNCGVHYAGSPNGVTIYDSPTGNPSGYNIELPGDQFFLNTQKLTLDRETTRDATRQRERLMFWFLEKLGLPNLHRRYVHVFLNGVERDQLIMEDVQKPNREVMEQWFADKGRLTKTNPWFEYDATGTVIAGAGPRALTNRLQHFTTTGGAKKRPRYRWTWSPAAGHDSAHDFSGIGALIDAAQAPSAEHVAALRSKADIRQWMRTFAMNDLASFWDTFGNPASKNAYLFESLETGIWSVVTWDMDVGLGVFNDPTNAALFPANVDSAVIRMFDEVAIVRDYWQALDEALGSFFVSGAGTEIDAILGETYDALIANGAAVTSPFVASGAYGLSVSEWIGQRRTFLLGEIAGKDAAFAATGPASSPDLFVTISGSAPLATAAITANGLPLRLDWSGLNEWSASVALHPGENFIELVAIDLGGVGIGAASLTIQYTGTETWPGLRINEWVALNSSTSGILDPADGEADDWFELYNPSAEPVPLDGWFLSDDPADPLQFSIPDGYLIPAGGFLLVWADGEPVQNAPATRQEIHAGFKLSAGGDSILLTAPDGSEIDRVDFGEQSSAIARRRLPDGAPIFTYTSSPTPAAANGAGIPPQPATNLSLSLAGGIATLEFTSATGGIYELETSVDLGEWASSSAPLVGNGGTQSFSFPVPEDDQFFLRVRSY